MIRFFINQIFFRSGLLANLEEQRDEALSAIIVQFQRVCRFHLAQRELKRRLNEKSDLITSDRISSAIKNDQITFRVGVKIIQRNVRMWGTVRGWHWFRLLARVKPMIEDHKQVGNKQNRLN